MSLFGNLFDENGDDSEDDESARIAQTKGSSAGDRSAGTCLTPDEKALLTEPEKPPAIRPEHGLCGILNRGATCYLNSLLQV